MAKEIKVIKCPQCGSPQKTETKPEHYRCDNCQTEYFLDNDHLTIEHHHTYQPPPPPPAPARLPYATVAVVAAVTVVVLVGLAVSGLLSTPLKQKSDVRALLPKDTSYATLVKAAVPTTDNAGQPLLLIIASRSYRSGDQPSALYASFYNPVEKQEIKTQKLTELGRENRLPNVQTRTFSNGALYVVINKTTLYQVDKAGLRLTDVGLQLFRGPAGLQAGVATLEFVPEWKGDGFSLFTNDGKNLFFYPLVNRLYTAEEIDQAAGGFDTLLPGAVDKTCFAFTDPGTLCPGEKPQLLEIKYKDNGGGPKDVADVVSCSRRNLGYNAATGRDTYQTVLLDDAAKANRRITAFRDLTPGRLYFQPKVLYSDAQRLLVTFQANANPQAPLSLQCLEPATGRIVWTTALGEQDEPEQASASNLGVLAATSRGALLLNPTGKIISQFEID